MQGFDNQFRDIKDYILQITYAIWEEKGVDKIRAYYGEKAPVYTPTSATYDVEEVVKGTLQTLHSFPDRTLLAEDIIHKSYPQDTYYSSHRIFSNMTHQAQGSFGKATGRLVQTRTIADCICKDNQVIEEWMVRDQSKIVKDIGLDVEEFGRSMGESLQEKGVLKTAHEYVNMWRGGVDSGDIEGIAGEIAKGLDRALTKGAIDELSSLHDRAAYGYFAGGVECYGADGVMRYMTALASFLSKAQFDVAHWITMQETDAPIRIALRWSLAGEHTGYGLYGTPTNAPLCVMGISHFELRAGKILRAFHFFDELSIFAQIAAYQIKH